MRKHTPNNVSGRELRRAEQRRLIKRIQKETGLRRYPARAYMEAVAAELAELDARDEDE